jgi:hypothetical protein
MAVRGDGLLAAKPKPEGPILEVIVQRNKRAIHLLFGVLEVDRPGDRRHGV